MSNRVSIDSCSIPSRKDVAHPVSAIPEATAATHASGMMRRTLTTIGRLALARQAAIWSPPARRGP
jgi:hypothetical protein